MKEIIKELRRQAASCNPKNQDRYEIEILLKSEQALQIVAAMEVATYPPIVRIALEMLGNIETDVAGHEFGARPYAAIDLDGGFFSFGNKPTFDDSIGWESEYAGYLCAFPTRLLDAGKFKKHPLLFQRTETGAWRWIGQSNQQDEYKQGN